MDIRQAVKRSGTPADIKMINDKFVFLQPEKKELTI